MNIGRIITHNSLNKDGAIELKVALKLDGIFSWNWLLLSSKLNCV